VIAARAVTVLLLGLGGLGGCSDGAAVGEACHRHSDCESTLQCTKSTCRPRCVRAPDCGDGYSCDEDGLCVAAHGGPGATCKSEVDCAPGLSCQIEVVDQNRIRSRCAAQNLGAPAGAGCVIDADCRNGTCALGRCADLCRVTRDCASGESCMSIPHVGADGTPFDGCLPSSGVLSWTIPPSSGEILLPVPNRAEHASLVISTAAPRAAGAVSVVSPSGRLLYKPCSSVLDVTCSEAEQHEQFFQNPIRHQRASGISVLALPSTSVAFETGAYRVRAMSFFGDDTPGPAPALTAVVRIAPASTLDLHFYFLDLDQHPCAAAFGNAKLDRTSAQVEAYFQDDFLDNLGDIFKEAGLDLGKVTYEDIDRPDLDGLEIGKASSLFKLGKYERGVNVFFVRNLSPIGIQAYGPSPGPGGLAGTAKSGIIVGLDTLCYRSWKQLARLTAHEIARYMGLYNNVEMGGKTDAILDSDTSPDNLMFYSELGGKALSPGQRDILRRSPVLR
jgi:hypothetical protein